MLFSRRLIIDIIILAHRKAIKPEITKGKNNKNVEYLCDFSPHGILPPMWIPEQSFHSTITVPLGTLRQFCDRA
uniref:Uncharacterized protein n=1 Tax=Romanomermis culicivorax TaxID=13658 RepID=A0A915HWN6_ROMCU